MINEKKKIIIFSGTTEGRKLSSFLESAGLMHTVCVATEYGSIMQPQSENILLEEGRKSTEEMENLFSEGTELVIDATHPFAVEVTENIKAAARKTNTDYLRVLRSEGAPTLDYEGLLRFDSVSDCANALSVQSGNILLTTGSKELVTFCEHIPDKNRLFVRVLPSAESLKLCESAGIRADHIIAAHGPFSEEYNLAMLRQYEISCLVTKESGSTGGFAEKVRACQKAGVLCFTIKRPEEHEGLNLLEAAEYLLRRYFPNETSLPVLHFDFIGTGMGSTDGLTVGAKNAIFNADLVFGAGRLLSVAEGKECFPYYIADDIIRCLNDRIPDIRGELRIALLFSGDLSFFSGAANTETALHAWCEENAGRFLAEFTRYPGISSVSNLAAKLGESYADARIISLHGKNTKADFVRAVTTILQNRSTYVLFSSGDDVQALLNALNAQNSDISVSLGKNMSLPDEELIYGQTDGYLCVSGPGLYTALFKNNEPQNPLLLPYVEDSELLRDKVPMTKAVVRHECVRLLRLTKGSVLYDIGSGTGSVSIEAARLCPDITVYAIERNESAIALTKKNIAHFSCDNIIQVEGEAPEALFPLAPPDAVFIGGSGGKLEEILDALKAKKEGIRVVITANTVETTAELFLLAKRSDIQNLTLTQLSVSNANAAGSYHLMKAENPVTIAAFTL